jgi:hypothetical protein
VPKIFGIYASHNLFFRFAILTGIMAEYETGGFSEADVIARDEGIYHPKF